jgi:hypothetical protein
MWRGSVLRCRDRICILRSPEMEIRNLRCFRKFLGETTRIAQKMLRMVCYRGASSAQAQQASAFVEVQWTDIGVYKIQCRFAILSPKRSL